MFVYIRVYYRPSGAVFLIDSQMYATAECQFRSVSSMFSSNSEFLLDVFVFLFVLDGSPGQKDYFSTFFSSPCYIRLRGAASSRMFFSLSFGILSKREKKEKSSFGCCFLGGAPREREAEKEGKSGGEGR